MANYVLAFAAGAATGVLLEKALAKMKAATVTERSEVLRSCFGEPMCTSTFTLEEARAWIEAREDKLKNGTKAIVIKANSDTIKELGKEININGVDNYLVIALVDKGKEIPDSILIKYERLDEELESILARGDGVLVVEE